ncbi:Protein OS-9 [Coemansia sp. RSA 1933]|nr:Protein OS-9 [Coemansia sp. RSA 1933]
MGIPHDSIQEKFNRLTVGMTRDEAIAEMGTTYTTDGNKLVWTCPGHASSAITVEFEDGSYVVDAFKDDSAGGRVFDPALIMEDVYESPRFQLRFIEEPMAASALNETIASIRQHAKEIESADDSTDKIHVAYDPLVLPAHEPWKLLCKVPRIDTGEAREKQRKKEERERQEADDQSALVSEMTRSEKNHAIERGLELLAPLNADCITYTTEYWSFEYCHNMYVRQFHRHPPDQNGQVLEVEYKLGEYTNRKQLGSPDEPHQTAELATGGEHHGRSDDDAARTTQLSTMGRSRYLTQVWGGGTLCDITRQPRQVEVQFHCDVNGHERIALVEEVVSCQYVVVINTPRLCADPLFYNTAHSVVHDIQCQHVVPDEQFQRVVDSMRRVKEMAQRKDNMAIGSDEPAVEAPSTEQEGAPEDKNSNEDKDDTRPQLVISLNDAKLAELTRGNEDVLQGFLAMIYGDPKLKVQFQQNQKEETEVSNKNDESKAIKIKKKKAPLKQKTHDEL